MSGRDHDYMSNGKQSRAVHQSQSHSNSVSRRLPNTPQILPPKGGPLGKSTRFDPKSRGLDDDFSRNGITSASRRNNPAKSSSHQTALTPPPYTYTRGTSPRPHRKIFVSVGEVESKVHQEAAHVGLDDHPKTKKMPNVLSSSRSGTPTTREKAHQKTFESTPDLERRLRFTSCLDSSKPDTNNTTSGTHNYGIFSDHESSTNGKHPRRASSPDLRCHISNNNNALECKSQTATIPGQSPRLSPVHLSEDSSRSKGSPVALNESTRKSNTNLNNNTSPPPYDKKAVITNVLDEDRYSPSPSILHTTRQGLVGLRNLGNTCYMNSILQCLSVTDKLRKLFLEERKEVVKKAKSRGVVHGYADLLKEMWEGEKNGGSVAPTMFKQRIQRLAPQFQGYSQHDSQEFLRFMLNGLHDELNIACPSKDKPVSPSPRHASNTVMADRAWRKTLAYDNSEVSAIFMGQLKSTLKCLTCGHESVTFDPFWDLSLPIPPKPHISSSSHTNIYSRSSYGSTASVLLHDCFKLFIKEEKLDLDNKPICEKCQSLQPGTKQLSIQRYPEILVIHLKRFSGVHFRTKLSTNVQFTEELSPPTSSDEVFEVLHSQLKVSVHKESKTQAKISQ